MGSSGIRRERERTIPGYVLRGRHEDGGNRNRPIQRTPPELSQLVVALKPLVRSGLPVELDFDDLRLLGLRGVVARSTDTDGRLSSVKALDELERRLLPYDLDDVLSEAAHVLFRRAPGTRGKNMTARRQKAADESGYEVDHCREHIEPKVVRQVAWQLLRKDCYGWLGIITRAIAASLRRAR